MAANQRGQSDIFRLPPELRNRIYDYASVTNGTNGANEEPGLFRTCRVVRSEGLKLFYATHVFSFSATRHNFDTQNMRLNVYQHFLTCIGAEKAGMIQHLRFQRLIDDRNFGDTDEVPREFTIDVVVSSREANVVSASFSRADVLAADLAALESKRVAMNKAWAAHENPTKAGLLRTLPALVPSMVRLERSAGDEGAEV